MTRRGRVGRHVTQVEVSRRAGVSRSVVSYVLNGGPRPVSDATRQRVLEAIRDLGYRPNKHAQMLIQEKWGSVASRQIGVVLANGAMFERPYYGEILHGLHEAVHAAHGHVRFIRLFEALEDPVLLNQLVHRHEVSGIVLVGPEPVLATPQGARLLARIRERVGNVVCVDGRHEGLPSVGFDRERAAFAATTHLLGLGHRRVAFLGHRDERVRGFEGALAGWGAEPVGVLDADDAPSGRAAGLRLLEGYAGPFALVTGSDEVAFGALRCLYEAGLRVPDDVPLVSIDDIGLAAFASPALTTVYVPKKEMGAQAVRMLLERAGGPLREGPVSLSLDTRLVIRESCGAA